MMHYRREQIASALSDWKDAVRLDRGYAREIRAYLDHILSKTRAAGGKP